jgi:hypothetical protein
MSSSFGTIEGNPWRPSRRSRPRSHARINALRQHPQRKRPFETAHPRLTTTSSVYLKQPDKQEKPNRRNQFFPKVRADRLLDPVAVRKGCFRTATRQKLAPPSQNQRLASFLAKSSSKSRSDGAKPRTHPLIFATNCDSAPWSSTPGAVGLAASSSPLQKSSYS